MLRLIILYALLYCNTRRQVCFTNYAKDLFFDVMNISIIFFTFTIFNLKTFFMDKYFKSDFNSQDTVATLFSEDVAVEICKYFNNLINEKENSEQTIDTEQWKCLLTLENAIKTIEKTIAPHIDNIGIAYESINKVNIEAVKMNELAENNSDNDAFMYSRFVEVFLSNPKYMQILSKKYNLTNEQEQELLRSIESDRQDMKDERLSCLIKDENFIKDITVLMQAAMLEFLQEISMSNDINTTIFTKMVLNSKACVEKFTEEYRLWEASTINKHEQYLFIRSRSAVTQKDSKEGIALSVANIFFLYFYVYTEQGRIYLFDETLKSVCNTPVKTGLFIKFLKEYEYGPDFCNAYRKYLDETGIDPIFNPNIFIPVEMPLELNIDTDNEHIDWFLPIPRKRFYKGSPKDIFESLHKLYLALREESLIDYNTPLDLFVYRFSGLLKPIGTETTMKWTSQNNKLAILINLLYNDDENRLPYAKVARFFGIEKSNLSQNYRKSESKDIKYISKILENCGFK